MNFMFGKQWRALRGAELKISRQKDTGEEHEELIE
jgi:hypothetical protein